MISALSPGKTLFNYIARQFLGWCGGVFLALLSVVFLLDYVELIRRSGSKPEATLVVLFEMAVLKQPFMAQQIMPFVILFGTMLAFWRLTRSNELVVARAAGVSVWQFLAPPLSAGAVIGILMVTVFNPVASVMQASYERLDDRILRSNDDQLTLSRTGLWLRQSDDDGNHSIVHADRYLADAQALRGVTMLFIANDSKLAKRIDAREAKLESGAWQVMDGTVWQPSEPLQTFEHVSVPTNLTPVKIQDSFAAPETMSFWELPSFIRLLEGSGFSALRHRLYFDALLARPLLFASMVLIAASFSLRMQRRGGTTIMIASGVAAGFALYFVSDVVFALGLSATIPVSLAAWTPAGVSCLLGVSLLLHLEDG
ncbi:MAG TPA: LPS export ABC transporter permease LptG [Stellaceae bacterium]|nr:LPS export ABC transporter permease LptG [Stellaceae bacterium]